MYTVLTKMSFSAGLGDSVRSGGKSPLAEDGLLSGSSLCLHHKKKTDSVSLIIRRFTNARAIIDRKLQYYYRYPRYNVDESVSEEFASLSRSREFFHRFVSPAVERSPLRRSATRLPCSTSTSLLDPYEK